MTTLNIESIEQKSTEYGNIIKLKSDGKTYSFFDTKRDGGKTKAYEQYEKIGLKVGDEVEAEVSEEQGEYEGKTFTRRKILYFSEVEDTPAVRTPKPAPKKSGGEIVKQITQRIDGLEKRVSELESAQSKKAFNGTVGKDTGDDVDIEDLGEDVF